MMPLAAYISGSSPRERGTPRDRGESGNPDRFIPARAGNAPRPPPPPSPLPVHPRASGERSNPATATPTPAGSSPRERGTPAILRRASRSDRFIPARAGNAVSGGRGGVRVAVHPRASGERSFRKSLIRRAFYDVKQRTGKLDIFRPRARGFGRYRSGWRKLHQLEAVQIHRHTAVDAAGIEVIAGFVR